MTNAHPIFNRILDNIKMTNNPPMTHQPIEEKWKEEFELRFMVPGGYINHERYSDVVSFIENLLEQEKKWMSEEIENYFDKAINAETENGFNADSKKKTKAEVLSIINK